MKKILSGVLAAAAVVSLTACGSSSSGSSQTTAAGSQPAAQAQESQVAPAITADVTKAEGEINLWTNLSQEEMNFYVEEFNKIVPGVKVNLTVMPSNEYRTKLQNAFRTGTNAPDVVTFEISDFGAYIDTDLLENLSQEQYGAEEVLSDMIPYVQELSRDKDGNIKGLTWQSTPGGFWYRKDLAREYLGTDDPEELYNMMSDWDKIIEVGEEVWEKSGGKIALLSDVEDILQIYASYKGAPWVDENGHILSDDYQLEMYSLMDEVVKNHVDAEADMWSAGWTSGVYSNDMYIMTALPTWGLIHNIKPGIPTDEMDKAENLWGVMKAPIPYMNGGTWYAMYSGSKNKDAAWAWIKTMTSNEDYLVNGLAGVQGDFPAYIPAIERCIAEGHTDIVTGDQEYYQDFYDIALTVKADPMTKYDRQAWVSAGAQMDLIATGQITPEEAVKGFNEDMKNIYPEINID